MLFKLFTHLLVLKVSCKFLCIFYIDDYVFCKYCFTSVFPIWCICCFCCCCSLVCFIALSGTFSTRLNTSGENILFSFLILGKIIQSLISTCNASWRFYVRCFVSGWRHSLLLLVHWAFFRKWIFGFINCFFCIFEIILYNLIFPYFWYHLLAIFHSQTSLLGSCLSVLCLPNLEFGCTWSLSPVIVLTPVAKVLNRAFLTIFTNIRRIISLTIFRFIYFQLLCLF